MKILLRIFLFYIKSETKGHVINPNSFHKIDWTLEKQTTNKTPFYMQRTKTEYIPLIYSFMELTRKFLLNFH